MEHGLAAEGSGASWVDAELAACDLGDRRLVERLRRLLGQLGQAIGQRLPLACQDWAGTKAAHVEALAITKARARKRRGVLVLSAGDCSLV